MKTSPVFRFKTVDEFKKDFGDNWSSSRYIPSGWDGNMTSELCGTPFVSNEIPNENNNNKVEYKGYVVNMEMLIPFDVNSEEYKKILVDLKEQEEFKKKFELSPHSDGNVKYFTYRDFYNISFQVHLGPTNNCQVGSIASIDGILARVSDPNKVKRILKTALLIAKFSKKLYIVDVNRRYMSQLEPLLYVPMTEYESTNGSSMAFGLIKID